MTQQELLADAAKTEVENTASLKQLLAMEEATKRKAAIIKSKFQGPLVKFHSRTVRFGDGEEKEEKACLRVINLSHPPVWLRRQRPLPLPYEPKCVMTGQAAKYR